MKIAFDLDGTLVANDDRTLRPNSLNILNKLKEDGHKIYLWSFGGESWASSWNSFTIKFPFVGIFAKQAPKVSMDLAVDNDGIGVPNGLLTYFCDDYSLKTDKVEDLSNVLVVVNELKKKGGLTEEFLRTSHIYNLMMYKKLRFSDYTDSQSWKPWNEKPKEMSEHDNS